MTTTLSTTLSPSIVDALLNPCLNDIWNTLLQPTPDELNSEQGEIAGSDGDSLESDCGGVIVADALSWGADR